MIFIDECGIDVDSPKEYGWGKRSERVISEKIGNRSKGRRISVIAALNYSKKELIAPFYYEGYTNTAVFVLWIEEVLILELKPNQVIIMDNASFHKSEKVRELIESVGCILLYLPTYSPDLNPIEHCWYPLKVKIRKARKFFDDISEVMEHVFKL